MPTCWPFWIGATSGSGRATWVLIFELLPAGTASAIGWAWPSLTDFSEPFQTSGSSTAWLASKSFRPSYAV